MTSLVPPLLLALAGFAAVFGIVIGSFLNVVAYRVPAGISLLRESRCPSCDSPVRWWQNVPVLSWLLLRGRCAACRTRISARYPAIEAATGLTFMAFALWWAAVTGLLGTAPASAAFSAPIAAQLLVLAAYLWFAASGLVLTVIDLDTFRLPHSITGSAFIACLLLLTTACALGADWAALLRALIGAGVLYGFYLLLRLARPDGMGGGDVRLAAVTGLMLAWIGWPTLAVGAFAAFLLGGVYGIVLIAARRAGRRTAVPFGPWIVAGSWIGVFAGETLGRAYLTLLGVL
ncbi:MAG: prepilin peptidase [Microbacterium sp.]|nr:prepilin peptidase [Microbacterium sp.]